MSVYTFSGYPGTEVYPDLGVVIHDGIRFERPAWYARWWNESGVELQFKDLDWSRWVVFRRIGPNLVVEKAGDRFVLGPTES
jgi:hypothetical protein